MRGLVLFAAIMALAAPADARRDRDAAAAALVPVPGEKALSCIPLNQVRESRVRDDRTIDFYTRGGGRIYRNRLPYACPQLGFEQSFSYATSLNQLCSTDIITVLNRTGGGISRGASCGLGEFQPVAGAPRASAAQP